jgi:hypothetical protein
VLVTVDLNDDRIPPELLAEQWYAFFNDVLGDLRTTFWDLAKGGLTQKIMAKRLGKKNSEVISRAMSGHKNLTIRYLHDLARAMGCRLEIKIVPLNSLKKANRPPMAKVEVATTEPVPKLAPKQAYFTNARTPEPIA